MSFAYLLNYSVKRGQGIVEYALVIAFVVVVAAGFLMGSNPVSNQVVNVGTNLDNALTEATAK